ncbi:MAG: tetratricopeptide repeat protein, partial [Candidatus Obscuribacterales bacterium]|nr:tetratricopeptide repeat protein [Candidatus Obscuribacterales bacterium]
YYKLAKIYLKQWRYREALEQLSKAIKLDPDRAVYYRTVSRVENSKGNIEEAIANQNKAVALSKDKSFELTELASMNRSAGHLDAAVLNLMEAIEINPENLTAHKQLVGLLIKQKRWDELVSEYKRVLKTKKKDSSLHYHLGEALLAMDKTDEAMAQYKLAANLNQSDPRPLRKLGAIYVGQKEFDKAIKVYTKALNSQPSPEVKDLVALGYCYAQNDSYLHAEAGFLTALALQQFPGYKSDSGPKREDILRSLASLLLIEGRYADASSQFESLYGMTRNTDSANDDQFLLRQSRALSSRKPEAIDELLSSFSKLGKDKQEAFRYSLVQSLLRLERAKDALSQIDEVKKTEVVKEPKWMILKARAKRQLKDMDEAAGILDRALEIANQDADEKPSLLADALVERARLKVELKALDEAETSATKALEVYAKMYASYLVLARVSLGNGKADDAIALARKALEQNPYFTEAYITIGDAYMKKQDYQKALEHYKKATELYPAYLSGHRGLLEAYKRLELSEEIRKEEDQIAQLEKIQ